MEQPKAVDLWAWSKVRGLLNESRRSGSQDYAIRDEATLFAANHHLVTPVSGAVVLETQAQYDRAGLVPEDKKHMHSVANTPEPSGSLMGLLAAFSLLHFARLQRRKRRPR